MLELARLIGADQPDVEVELVAYTLEEPPFFGGPEMGSAFHAASVASEKSRIIGVIVLEMIGYFSDEPGSQSYPVPILKGYYPDRGILYHGCQPLESKRMDQRSKGWNEWHH